MNVKNMGIYSALGGAVAGIDSAIDNMGWLCKFDKRTPEMTGAINSLRGVRVFLKDQLKEVEKELE